MKVKRIFKAAAGAQFPETKAQEFGEALYRIADRHGGEIQTEIVIAEARSLDNPLHKCFEWDDKKAAHCYRIKQAQNLINHILIIKEYKDEERSVNAFHSVMTEDKERAYVPIEIILADKSYHQQLIQEALGEIQHWKSKYKDLNELEYIFGAIEETQKRLNLDNPMKASDKKYSKEVNHADNP